MPDRFSLIWHCVSYYFKEKAVHNEGTQEGAGLGREWEVVIAGFRCVEKISCVLNWNSNLSSLASRLQGPNES